MRPDAPEEQPRNPESNVSATTVVVMVLVLGFVWGGFALILALAFRKEREKLLARDRQGSDPE